MTVYCTTLNYWMSEIPPPRRKFWMLCYIVFYCISSTAYCLFRFLSLTPLIPLNHVNVVPPHHKPAQTLARSGRFLIDPPSLCLCRTPESSRQVLFFTTSHTEQQIIWLHSALLFFRCALLSVPWLVWLCMFWRYVPVPPARLVLILLFRLFVFVSPRCDVPPHPHV